MTRAIRLFGLSLLLLAFVIVPSALARTPSSTVNNQAGSASADEVSHVRPICDENAPLCTEVAEAIGYEGRYTGHDEPSLLFYSNVPGAGNNNLYSVRLPNDPPKLPTQDGTGGTFNFQLHPAFWLGMALCDNQSAPEYTHAACVPDSDSNIFDGSDPAAADYIGKHPGTAFLELQFYPPGWVPWPAGNSCDATRWCAAMAIFSFNRDQNSNPVTNNNADCLGKVGLEPANFAFITKSGAPHSPPSPLGLTLGSFTPDEATDLFMNSGDRLSIDMHDTAHGLQIIIRDLTTGQRGSMTAGAANGFAQVNYDPIATTCTETPYAFRPMYSTSSEHTRVPWAAHSYNVAFSDEIGHFEYCDAADPSTGECTAAGVNDPGGLDDDDVACFNPSDSTRILIGGCIGTDNDFDGVSYQHTWPGSLSDRRRDRQFNPGPIIFSSPRFQPSSRHGEHEDLQNYSRVAFEADLPRIEAADFGGICNRDTGANCVNPPPGANFYPIFSTTGGGEGCLWQEGGTNIPGTTNTFGGTSTAEFGPLLFVDYPGPGFTPIHRTNDFRQVLNSNPCPSHK